MTDTKSAAEILTKILEQLPATHTAKDTRQRQAIGRAAAVLRHGHKPLPAVERVYQGTHRS